MPLSSVSEEPEPELEAVYMCTDSVRLDTALSVLSRSLEDDLLAVQLWPRGRKSGKSGKSLVVLWTWDVGWRGPEARA